MNWKASGVWYMSAVGAGKMPSVPRMGMMSKSVRRTFPTIERMALYFIGFDRSLAFLGKDGKRWLTRSLIYINNNNILNYNKYCYL